MTWTRKRRTHLRSVGLAVLLATVVLLYLNPPFFGSTPDRVESSEPAAAPLAPALVTAATDYLPFDMPIGPTPKKVFAHYVPWFPISPDNLPADRDYYTTQYMSPTGEGGTHSAYGGYLRDRPLPRPPIKDPNWMFKDIQTDVERAKSIGIDGFGVDIVSLVQQGVTLTSLLDAALAAGDFTIQITPDMTGPLNELSADAFASAFAPYLTRPSAQRLGDGRVVLGAFSAELKPVEWWKAVLNSLRVKGIDVAFVPTFLDAHQHMDRFASISYGFSNWGGRDPVELGSADASDGSAAGLIRKAHQMGAIWMQSIPFQDVRPRSGAFWESENGVTNRRSWLLASDGAAEWVNLITWNDFAESTAMAPSIKHGFGILDMNAYQVAHYKYGDYPRVLRDAVFIVYRTQPFAVSPVYPETMLMKNVGQAPTKDLVEVQFFAKDAAVGSVWIGGDLHRCPLPAGFTVCTFPLGRGEIAAGLSRDDNDNRLVVRSPFEVTDTPYVQDLQYVVAGGLR